MGHRGQSGRGTGMGGEGKGGEQGKGGGKLPQPEVQAVPCILPGIQPLPAHHAHHQHQPICNIEPDMGDLIPAQPPQPPRQPPSPAYTAPPRATQPPRHGSHGRSRGRWRPPQRRGGPARNRRGWCRSHGRSRHGEQWGPRIPLRPGTIASGTGTRSPTPWGAKPSSW